MTALWHPLSAVYLDAPRSRATAAVVRMMLAAEGGAAVVYGGDRMWPALRHGQRLAVRRIDTAPRRGDVVLAIDAGILDLVRIAGLGEAVEVSADADPAPPRSIAAGDLVASVDSVGPRGPGGGALARAWLEIVEAATGSCDPVGDPAETVREKYDAQAAHYARIETAALDPSLEARLARHVGAGSTVLVAGSGTGREALAIEAAGHPVRGVDFSPRMVAIATAAARERGSTATFVAADLRAHAEPPASVGAIVFTYDVYSFIPGAKVRVAVLMRMRDWLAPGGALFLSARLAGGGPGRALLTLQWLSGLLRGRVGEWGDSHTRWLDESGVLRRSFVRVFSRGQLEREAARAGFRPLGWAGGHGVFVPADRGA